MLVNYSKRICLAISILLFISSASFAGEKSKQHDQQFSLTNCGFTQTFKTIPSRSVTLNQSATEVMLLLGLSTNMVGTAYLDDQILPEYQKAYNSVPVIAKKYPSKEVLFGVEPDFVYGGFVSAFTDRAAGSREDLNAIGVTSYLCPAVYKNKQNPDAMVGIEYVYQEIQEVAQIFGVEQRAEKIILDMKQKLLHVKKTIGPQELPLKVFWYDSGDKLPYVGTGTGMPNFIIESVMAENIFKDVKGGWKKVNWEDVIERNPDLIVLIQADWSSAEEKKNYLLQNPSLSSLSAVKNNRFAVIDFSSSTPGIRNIHGIERLAKQIYPEKF